jgi:bisphosphoglycerate-dependent phosphoglycerate mutase
LNKFLKDTSGKTVFVVGHSNTIPSLVNLLIGKKKYTAIEDTNNSNFYIVIRQKASISDHILVID